MQLNTRALELCLRIIADAAELRAGVCEVAGATVVDLGIEARGGLEAGRRMAEVCLAGLGEVAFVPGDPAVWPGPAVQVRTDQPVAACMASQYAGWQIAVGKYFAMGSGPMRAAAGKEALFDLIGFRETSDCVVGVLETRKLPTEEVVNYIGKGVRNLFPLKKVPDTFSLTLLVAPTASQAGTVQVVARSVETALHKLHELGFDLSRVESGYGVAPLPPMAKDDLAGIGRTNDAVLYGGKVTLWVRGDDASLQAIGPRVPSGSSPDHGRPFAEIFERAGRDFYKIDPLLFSPAVVRFCNLDSGRYFSFGETRADVLRETFGS